MTLPVLESTTRFVVIVDALGFIPRLVAVALEHAGAALHAGVIAPIAFLHAGTGVGVGMGTLAVVVGAFPPSWADLGSHQIAAGAAAVNDLNLGRRVIERTLVVAALEAVTAGTVFLGVDGWAYVQCLELVGKMVRVDGFIQHLVRHAAGSATNSRAAAGGLRGALSRGHGLGTMRSGISILTLHSYDERPP